MKYIGELPGFYWDSEKQKYFNIQSSHAAPVNAKHTRENVMREARNKHEQKRQKLEQDERYKQTVRPARSLQSSLAGFGLQREMGYLSPGPRAALQNATLVSGLEPRYHASDVIKGEPWLTAITDTFCGISTMSHPDGAVVMRDSTRYPRLFLPISPCIDVRDDLVLVWWSDVDSLQLYWGPFRDDISSIVATSEIRSVWNHAFGSNGNLAFVGIGVVALSAQGDTLGLKHFSDNEESFAASWQQPGVLAFGYSNESRKPSKTRHAVKLWDTRVFSSDDTLDTSSRIKLPMRATGLEFLDSHRLLVTSNHTIGLFDLRMSSDDRLDPLWSIPHTSVGSCANLALKDDILAIEDQDRRIQLYSLQNAKRLRTLVPSNFIRPSGPLRWIETESGLPALQSCSGPNIHTWAWHPSY